MSLDRIHRAASLATLSLAALGLAAACSVNPATGERQLALFGREQEVEMGREADKQVVQSIGVYPDPELERYVGEVGKKLAAVSERPDLPWSFKVADDPSINAFALPGGYIYVTRGILTYFTNEAELAAVLGHEIGHVTARHSVEQVSRAQLAQLGLGIGMIASQELRSYGDIAQQGLGVLFLKFSRDDERQADDLGLRYVRRTGYDARQMVEVFRMLERASRKEAAGARLPGWLSTHPTPENRIERISGEIRQGGGGGTAVARDRYLEKVDGVVFGDDPREGYFEGGVFYHPALAFQIRFPDGWKGSNGKQSVRAVAPGEDAAVVLQISDASSAAAAEKAFLSQDGVSGSEAWEPRLPGMSARGSRFSVDRGSSEQALAGLAAWVEHGGKVYQLLGYTLDDRFDRYHDALARAIGSFRRVTDRKVLEVEPKRLAVVTLPSAMTLGQFARRYPSTVDLETLATLNQAEPDTRFDAGTRLKRVVGGR